MSQVCVYRRTGGLSRKDPFIASTTRGCLPTGIPSTLSWKWEMADLYPATVPNNTRGCCATKKLTTSSIGHEKGFVCRCPHQLEIFFQPDLEALVVPELLALAIRSLASAESSGPLPDSLRLAKPLGPASGSDTWDVGSRQEPLGGDVKNVSTLVTLSASSTTWDTKVVGIKPELPEAKLHLRCGLSAAPCELIWRVERHTLSSFSKPLSVRLRPPPVGPVSNSKILEPGGSVDL